MRKNTIQRYIWLVDVIYRSVNGITFQEIQKKWLASPLSENQQYEWRTFMKHKNDLYDLFGIKVDCNKSDNTYHLDRSDVGNASGFKQWLIEGLSLNGLLKDSVSLRNRIQFESVPSGHENLPVILEAMQEGKMMTFSYKPYWREEPSHLFHVEGYAVKMFKRRWYLLAKYGASPLKIYALDRIYDIDIEFEDFRMPDDFDVQNHFNSYFGVILEDIEPQLVKIKVDNFQSNYLRSLPLHHSQKELSSDDTGTIFTVFIRPTYDFIQELLSIQDKFEVLEPLSLRKRISAISKNLYEMNKGTGKRKKG